MKAINSQIISIGALAGIIAATIGLLTIGTLPIIPPFSIILGCLISLPIFVTAFGWGTSCSFITLLSATIVMTLVQKIHIAFGFFLFFFAPAFYAAWLLGFAQSDENGKGKKWFPLSSVFFTLITFIAMINVFIGLYFHYNPDTPMIAEQISTVLANALAQTNSVSAVYINNLKAMIVQNIVPFIASILATYGVIFLIGNLYFSTLIAQKLNCLTRPRDDWPSNLHLPLKALFIFAAAFLISFIETNSILDLVAFVFNAVFTLALSITGLAYLHNITRKIKGRTFILSAVYIALFTPIFALPSSILLLLVGIRATIQHNHQNSGLKI